MPFRFPIGAITLVNRQSLLKAPKNPHLLVSRLGGDALTRLSYSSSVSSHRSWLNRSRRRRAWRGDRVPKSRPSQSVELKTSFLGEPGGITVVAHGEHRRRKTPVPRDQVIDSINTEDAVPFILNELDKEELTVEDEAVEQRIEAFRFSYMPNTGLSSAEWEEIRSNIVSSFTADQLMRYLSAYQLRRPLSRGTGSSTQWKPGTSIFLEDDLGVHNSATYRLATLRHLKGKKLLAERILRDCWHLGIVAEVGQQDIRLPKHRITALLNSDNFSFEEIASLNEAKIDITQSLGLVRITGTKAACESISDTILDATGRIREDEFETSPQANTIFKGAFTRDLLDKISKWYGVSFTLNTGNFPDKVIYLAENKGGAESARRNLNLAANKNSSPVPFCTYLSASEPASIYAVDPESKSSYFDRQKNWFRWAMSSTQSTEGTTLDTPFFNEHQAHLSDVLLKLLRHDTSATIAKRGAVGIQESISAAVGRCLFMNKSSITEGDHLSASELGEMSARRIFISDIPKATSFLRSLPMCPSEDTQRHRILLFPTAVNADIFPELELELAVNEAESFLGHGSEITLRSAKAILSKNSVDFLLPENSLDLRFTRTIHYDLLDKNPNTSAVSQAVQTLEETMKTCLHGILSADSISMSRVPLPAFCHISLPRHVLKNYSGTTTESDSSGQYASAEYMFQPVNDARGTQIHQYDFRGRRLNYLFYESGPFFASNKMDVFVSIDLKASEQTKSSSDSVGDDSLSDGMPSTHNEFSAFYRSTCNLAFELNNAWRAS